MPSQSTSTRLETRWSEKHAKTRGVAEDRLIRLRVTGALSRVRDGRSGVGTLCTRSALTLDVTSLSKA
jgi:hypothetical protein